MLDTSPYPTRAAADAQQVVLRKQDAGGLFAQGLTQEIANRCRALGITYSFKDEYVLAQNANRIKPLSLGRTELGRLVTATGGEISGTTLQIPTTGYHTTQETAAISSVAAGLQLLFEYI